MEPLKTNSNIEMIGEWAGWEFPDMAEALKNTDLAELLALVRAEVPGYADTADIMRAVRDCRNALIGGTGLSISEIQALLNFTGTAKMLIARLNRAIADGALTQAQKETVWDGLETLRSLRIARCWELLKAGALPAVGQAVQVFEQTNKILDTYTTTLSKIMRGIPGVNDTLEVQSVVVGAGYSVPATSQTSLDHQLGSAKAYSESVYTGYQTTFFTSFLTADNNGLDTTVSVYTNPTTVTLTSTTGLSVGDRLWFAGVGTSGEWRTINTLPGANVVTLTEALSSAPAVTSQVVQGWGETGLLINGDSVLGTRSRISDGGFAKTSSKPRFVESAVTLRIVGS